LIASGEISPVLILRLLGDGACHAGQRRFSDSGVASGALTPRRACVPANPYRNEENRNVCLAGQRLVQRNDRDAQACSVVAHFHSPGF
jgi:hypothetical protein